MNIKQKVKEYGLQTCEIMCADISPFQHPIVSQLYQRRLLQTDSFCWDSPFLDRFWSIEWYKFPYRVL